MKELCIEPSKVSRVAPRLSVSKRSGLRNPGW
jgi:hypothetical protein